MDAANTFSQRSAEVTRVANTPATLPRSPPTTMQIQAQSLHSSDLHSHRATIAVATGMLAVTPANNGVTCRLTLRI